MLLFNLFNFCCCKKSWNQKSPVYNAIVLDIFSTYIKHQLRWWFNFWFKSKHNFKKLKRKRIAHYNCTYFNSFCFFLLRFPSLLLSLPSYMKFFQPFFLSNSTGKKFSSYFSFNWEHHNFKQSLNNIFTGCRIMN